MEILNKLKESIGKKLSTEGDVAPSILDDMVDGNQDPSLGFGKILGEVEEDLSNNESFDYVIGYSIGLVIILIIIWRLLS